MGDRDIQAPLRVRETSVAQDSPYVLGGGIGSGKSTVLNEFARYGFAIVQADGIGHEVLLGSHRAGRAVMARWPETVVDGEVDRAKLASIVFNDPAELAHLEAITHPAIRTVLSERVENALAEAHARGVVIEIPLLRVMAATPWRKLAVIAPADVRIQRAVARGADLEDVLARIANQEPDEAWAEWADIVIDNGGEWEATEAQIARIVQGVQP